MLQCMTFNLSKLKIRFIILLRNGNCRVAHQCLLPYSTLAIAHYAFEYALKKKSDI